MDEMMEEMEASFAAMFASLGRPNPQPQPRNNEEAVLEIERATTKVVEKAQEFANEIRNLLLDYTIAGGAEWADNYLNPDTNGTIAQLETVLDLLEKYDLDF